MYVAVTRAEDLLFIMLPLGTVDRRTGLAAAPSRFLAALPGGSGVSLYQNDREMDLGELWNLGGEDDYSSSSRTQSPAAPPRAATPPIVRKPAARPDPVPALEVIPGMRISHPIYGPGLVASVEGGQAVIEFDLFGRKNVVLQYARLTAL